MATRSNILSLLWREIAILIHHPIYIICMVVLPLFVMFFFTSLMNEGQPVKMPIGIVDEDNTTTTRRMTRLIDGFQSSRVIAHYPSVNEARRAIQRNEIYGFILFPENMTQDLLSSRQPRMSVYFSNTSYTAGALLYKEMKTLTTLGNAAVGQTVLQAKGATKQQTAAFLQPISLDAHDIGNPWVNYNIYLSTMLVPTSILLFTFLITVYSLGTEIKFGTHKKWLARAGGNFPLALLMKLLPQTIIFSAVMFFCLTYMFGILHFPIPGGPWRLLALDIFSVIAAQGFALFIFGLIPSLRMALSVCSLWGVLSFSMVGSAFPIFAMDAPLQTMAWLFPMRHYYIIYQLCVFNNFPLTDALPHIIALIAFILLPLLTIRRMDKAFHEFGYQP